MHRSNNSEDVAMDEPGLAPLRLAPLGDQGVLAYLPDESAALAFATGLRVAGWPWLVDVVPAYGSVGVFFDPRQIRSRAVLESLRSFAPSSTSISLPTTLHRIPCCYEMGLDLERVAGSLNIGAEEVIRRHASLEYTVFAIGFSPGFPYLGYLPEGLAGVPRLPSPRLRVEPGSVGMTGRQTGIYPQPRPGGWNLIGRTPLLLVDVEDGYFPLRVGDRVRFERVDESEYRQLLGDRLPGDRADSDPLALQEGEIKRT